MWDGGVVLISAALILAAHRRVSLPLLFKRWMIIAAGASLFGFTFTVSGIEGQTVPLTFPAAAAGFFMTCCLLVKDLRRNIFNPYLLFFALGFGLSVILFSYWGLTHPGFSEFSQLGWI